MGWASGSEVMGDCIKAIKSEVAVAGIRYGIYKKMIRAFEDADCDTLCECLGIDPQFDGAWNDLYPEES